MTIGRVADAAGVSIDTLRFYERRGLIARPRRSVAGYRIYSDDVLGRLRFIRDAKAVGFSLHDISELLALGVKSTSDCGPVTRKAQAKLAEMSAEIRRLQRLRGALEKMIRNCAVDCGGPCARGCARCRSIRNRKLASELTLDR